MIDRGGGSESTREVFILYPDTYTDSIVGCRTVISVCLKVQWHVHMPRCVIFQTV
jgi:hypothetical protein